MFIHSDAQVHRGGHGRDGVHRGRVQHERPGVRVSAVPGRHRRRRGLRGQPGEEDNIRNQLKTDGKYDGHGVSKNTFFLQEDVDYDN